MIGFKFQVYFLFVQIHETKAIIFPTVPMKIIPHQNHNWYPENCLQNVLTNFTQIFEILNSFVGEAFLAE